MDMKKTAFGVAASMFIAAASVTGATYIIDKRAANEPEPVIKIIRAEETSSSTLPPESAEHAYSAAEKHELHSIDICTAAQAPFHGRSLEYRSENPFSVPEDIMNVKGIGEKKFEDILPYIYIGGGGENESGSTGT